MIDIIKGYIEIKRKIHNFAIEEYFKKLYSLHCLSTHTSALSPGNTQDRVLFCFTMGAVI